MISDNFLNNAKLATQSAYQNKNNHIAPTIKFIIYDTVHDKTFDVSNLIGSMSISSQIYDYPETLNFTIYTPEAYSQNYGLVQFWEGAVCYVYLDDVPYFKGVLYAKSRNEDVRVISCTAYSYIRYMQYAMVYTREAVTVTDVFKSVLETLGIEHEVSIGNLSEYTLQEKVHDNVTAYEIVRNAIDEHLAMTGQRLYLKDNFGVITLTDIEDCVTEYVLGDTSFVMGYEYNTDIESSFNTIKVIKKTDDEGSEQETVERNDPSTEKWWGTLQHIEIVDDSYSTEAMEQLAEQLLELYDQKTRTITLNCVGIPYLHAGDLFRLTIADMGDLPNDRYMLAEAVSHEFENNIVNTSIEAKITIIGET